MREPPGAPGRLGRRKVELFQEVPLLDGLVESSSKRPSLPSRVTRARSSSASRAAAQVDPVPRSITRTRRSASQRSQHVSADAGIEAVVPLSPCRNTRIPPAFPTPVERRSGSTLRSKAAMKRSPQRTVTVADHAALGRWGRHTAYARSARATLASLLRDRAVRRLSARGHNV